VGRSCSLQGGIGWVVSPGRVVEARNETKASWHLAMLRPRGILSRPRCGLVNAFLWAAPIGWSTGFLQSFYRPAALVNFFLLTTEIEERESQRAIWPGPEPWTIGGTDFLAEEAAGTRIRPVQQCRVHPGTRPIG
jgi:hypothetical protein